MVTSHHIIVGKLDCPSCGKPLDGATGNHNKTPGEGYLCIRAYCYAILAFKGINRDLHFERLTDDEIEALPTDIKTQFVILKLHLMRRK